MSFRKRNFVVSSAAGTLPSTSKNAEKSTLAGTRASPLDGRLTTSTGTRSLDAVLASHGGLALGTSLLVEERGATDFSGTLLRYYAAEGILQGHHVHVLGVSDMWARELPGVINVAGGLETRGNDKGSPEDKMKIAWRYERLGEFGRERPQPVPSTDLGDPTNPPIFCHDFDLSKRLSLSSSSFIRCMPVASQTRLEANPGWHNSPFKGFLQYLNSQLGASSPTIIHRIVVPALLSPAAYPHTASAPEQVLQFLHALRALLRKHPNQLTAFISLPTSLHPRATGMTRWMETICDGVLEIVPFQPWSRIEPVMNLSSQANRLEEGQQGMIKMHRLPILDERGGGAGESSRLDNLAFTLSRRKGLVINPFCLPPIDGDIDLQKGGPFHGHGKDVKIDIDF